MWNIRARYCRCSIVRRMYCVPKYSFADPKFIGGDRRKARLTHPAPIPTPLQTETSILGRQSASVSICSSFKTMDFDPPLRKAPNPPAADSRVRGRNHQTRTWSCPSWWKIDVSAVLAGVRRLDWNANRGRCRTRRRAATAPGRASP